MIVKKTFRTTIDTDEMIELTSKLCTGHNSSDLYLSWMEMKWRTYGNVRIYNETRKNMCKYLDSSGFIILTGIF